MAPRKKAANAGAIEDANAGVQNANEMPEDEKEAKAFLAPGPGKPDNLEFALEDDDAAADEPFVQVRVLKKGHGKVATGRFSRSKNRFTFHKRGDELRLPVSVAEAQEDNGHVEIVDPNYDHGDEE